MMKPEEEFAKTYKALVQTLVQTYNNPAVEQHSAALDDDDTMPKVIRGFLRDLKPFETMLLNSDSALFSQGVPSLLRLGIPGLWMSDRFTDNSKKYMWCYISSLYKNAKDYLEPDDKESSGSKSSAPTPAADDPMDIAQPPGMDIPGIKEICEQLPSGIMNKVKAVADKYGKQVESGEMSIDKIRFDEISKELFSQMDPAEMSKLVGNVGSVIQSLGTNGDISSLLAGLAQPQQQQQP